MVECILLSAQESKTKTKPSKAGSFWREGMGGAEPPNNQNEAQQSGFVLERRNGGADAQTADNGKADIRRRSGASPFRRRPGVAQLVARLLWEQDAAGSNPVTRTKKEESPLGGSSFFIERQSRTCGIPFQIAARLCRRLRGTAAGSNPVTRTIKGL